jgi:hypothetical protein
MAITSIEARTPEKKEKKQLARRDVLGAGAGVAGFTFLPSRVLGR